MSLLLRAGVATLLSAGLTNEAQASRRLIEPNIEPCTEHALREMGEESFQFRDEENEAFIQENRGLEERYNALRAKLNTLLNNTSLTDSLMQRVYSLDAAMGGDAVSLADQMANKKYTSWEKNIKTGTNASPCPATIPNQDFLPTKEEYSEQLTFLGSLLNGLEIQAKEEQQKESEIDSDAAIATEAGSQESPNIPFPYVLGAAIITALAAHEMSNGSKRSR